MTLQEACMWILDQSEGERGGRDGEGRRFIQPNQELWVNKLPTRFRLGQGAIL